ncbi:MAG TPA: hypothetical protein VGE62_03925 [Candidatus Paceibacterota bacterium]
MLIDPEAIAEDREEKRSDLPRGGGYRCDKNSDTPWTRAHSPRMSLVKEEPFAVIFSGYGIDGWWTGRCSPEKRDDDTPVPLSERPRTNEAIFHCFSDETTVANILKGDRVQVTALQNTFEVRATFWFHHKDNIPVLEIACESKPRLWEAPHAC